MVARSNGVQRPHILIIDDDLEQLRVLVSALKGEYRVSFALDGDQGYARAAVLLPDLILLDVRMPGRNGVVVAHFLKKNASTQHIPILFLSALTEEHQRLEGLRAGAVDYICKPFSVNEVLERVRIHLMLSRRVSSEVEGPVASFSEDLVLKLAAIEFIHENLSDSGLKGAQVASRLQVSVRRLNAVFEANEGMTVFEFIRQERMRRAAWMLEQTTLPVGDVAEEVGYGNSANFATEFKKYWGKSPSQLRIDTQKSKPLT